MNDSFSTARLRCRPLVEEDGALLHPLFSDVEVMQYFGPERILTETESISWLVTHERLRMSEGFAPWTLIPYPEKRASP